MADLKDNVVNEVLKYKPVKYLITFILFVLAISICYSLINHYWRCHNNENSRLFWGMDECSECKIVVKKIDSVTKHDTVYQNQKPLNQTFSFPKKILGKKQLAGEQKNENGDNNNIQRDNNGIQGKDNNNNHIVNGTNNGVNGDVYSEKQLLDNDKQALLNMIQTLKNQHAKLQKCFLVTIMSNSNGQKVASQISDFLKQQGYREMGYAQGLGNVKGVQIGMEGDSCVGITVGILP